MRNWQAWTKDIASQLFALEQEGIIAPGTFGKRSQCSRFFQVELIIALHEEIIQHLNGDQDVKEAWSLLTGFVPYELSQHLEWVRRCRIVRHRTRYVRPTTAWQRSLKWYVSLPQKVRLYDVNLVTGSYKRQPLLQYVANRVQLIREAINTVAKHQKPEINVAQPDRSYNFFVGFDTKEVTISQEMIEGAKVLSQQAFASPPLQKRDRKTPPVPIKIRISDLRQAAIELDTIFPKRNWLQDFERLQVLLIHNRLSETQEFTIEGIFHLLGPTGSGKTTLIYLLVYLLTKLQSPDVPFRICILASTVTDQIRTASELKQMGIAAAPILGKSRDLHRYQYGMSNLSSLQPEDLFQLVTADENSEVAKVMDSPELEWLTGSCILSGLLEGEETIPFGQEPCNKLITAEDMSKKKRNPKHSPTHHACPFLPFCPAHQANREIGDAVVWVTTSAAFVHTPLPVSLVNTKMYLLEAVYHYCDLLIVDEADRALVFIDDRMAPATDLAATETNLPQKAVLDFLKSNLMVTGRSLLVDPRYQELCNVVREADGCVDWIFARLGEHAHLRDWISGLPLYDGIVYNHLIDEIAKIIPAQIPEEERATCLTKLEEEFRQFYTNLQLTHGDEQQEALHPLEILVSNSRNQLGYRMVQLLRGWLSQQLSWELEASPQVDQILERLELGVVLTALNHYVVELVRYWLDVANEITDESGNTVDWSQKPPQELIDIGVESPLGNVLGYQFVDSSTGQSFDGVLRYLDCLGLGRYLLLRFPFLYTSLDGTYGPHLLLTSATSWSPGSPQYHISVPPSAILVPSQTAIQSIEDSVFEFVEVPDRVGNSLRVSGLYGTKRRESLLNLGKYLALGSGGGALSRIEAELNYWQKQGVPRGALLVTGNYNEAQTLTEMLQETSQWRDRVLCMQPDRDMQDADWFIRRGQIEELPNHNKPVLIAPLSAFQRGYNVLIPGTNMAYLGSVFLLVRPFPVPTDFGRQIRSINRWLLDRVLHGDNILPNRTNETVATTMRSIRAEAYREWGRRLRTSQLGAGAIDTDLWNELLWDQLVAVVQLLGRATRGGVPTRVFFCDSAFYPKQKGQRSLLKGWMEALAMYLSPDSQKPLVEQELAKILYGPFYNRLEVMLIDLELQQLGGKR